MKFKLFLSGLFLLVLQANGQMNYAVSGIPKNLLTRAGAVVRLSETEIRVNDLTDVSYRYKTAVTILNQAGSEEAEMVFYYDKVKQIKSIKGVIYNEFGLPTGKFNEKIFADRSAVSNYSLYEDDRLKYYKPAITTYPYTVEYEVEIKSKQSLYFPNWHPFSSTNVALEKSSFKFIAPADFKVRHEELAFKGDFKEGTEGTNKVLTWELSGIPALKDEPYSPHYEQFLPTVKLAPETFAFKGIKGSFSNWNEYGKWMNETLLKGRDVVSEQTKQEILQLVSTISSPKEKAKKIYEYMQNKTRYISVQIGIGGYQPFPASEVDRLGYGDCKGLVNYTKALLNVAGIESYYCIVYSGRFKKDIETNFTSLNQGDHIILCLPFKTDTTWLECTSKFAPFGFLGDFTDDRQVLAVTPEGGKLLRTPKLKPSDNTQIRTADFTISADGGISGKVITKFAGSQYDNDDELFNEPYAEQIKKVTELYPRLVFEVKNLQFKKTIENAPVTIETLDLTSTSYCTLNEGKLYLPLNKLNYFSSTPKEVRNRVNPVHITRGYYDEDVTTFTLPSEYKAAAPTEKKVLENPFGKYSYEVQYNGNKITYKRTMQFNEGTFKPEQYEELVEFFQQIKDLDAGMIVLNKTK